MKKVFLFILLLTLSVAIFVMPQAAAFADSGSSPVGTDGVKGMYLIDYDTGTVLCAYNENQRMPIASMVKIMTLLLAFEAVESGQLCYEQELLISDTASGMGGSQMFLDANKEYKVEDLIKGVTVCSANDAAAALAESIAGSIEAFVALMNQKARSLGMNDTVFCNTTGLPGGEQYSTARDVSVMTRELLKHKDYYKYTGIWMEDYAHPDGRITQMVNTNKLVRFYKGCDSGKTGFTNEAMFCLSASASRNNMRVVATVLGGADSKTRFKAVTDMFNYAFANYEQRVIVKENELIANDIVVKNGREERVEIYCDADLKVFAAKKKQNEYSVACDFYENLKAPIKAGSAVGKIKVLDKDGNIISECNLRVKNDVEKATYLDAIRKLLKNWLIKK